MVWMHWWKGRNCTLKGTLKEAGEESLNNKPCIRNTIYKTTDEKQWWKKIYDENINHKNAGVDK